MNNKYKIGQAVFIYEDGWLMKKEVKEITSVTNHNETNFFYRFKGENLMNDCWIGHSGKHEAQVFLSKEDFISSIKYDE